MLLKPQANRYWASLGLFPRALEARDNVDARRQQAIRALQGLGLGNLRFLHEHWQLPRSDDDFPHKLGESIISSAGDDTVYFLREFHRSRVRCVDEVFDRIFGAKKGKQISASIEQLSNRSEDLRSFTKLLLLYDADPKLLNDVFYLHLWRSRSTSFVFRSNKNWPKNLLGRLTDAIKELEKPLGKAVSKKQVRFEAAFDLPDGTRLFLFHREHYPVIKRDFSKEFNLHHPCGQIVFGLNAQNKTVEIRTANSKIATTIRGWFQQAAKVPLMLARALVFSNYDPEAVVNAFLGAYPADSGIELLSAKFSRSALPEQSALTLTALQGRQSIRKDLETLKENDILKPASLTDIAEVEVSFGDKRATILLQQDPGGAFLLAFDNLGWDEVSQENFEDAFRGAFGIPVNQLVDTSKLALGTLGIIAHLLTARRSTDVLPYQKAALTQLVEDKLLYAKTCDGQSPVGMQAI